MTSSENSAAVTKWKYIALVSIMPLFHNVLQGLVFKLQERHRNEGDGIAGEEEEEQIMSQRRLARERQYALANGILKLIKLGLPLCKLGLLLSMLWKPKEQNYAPRLSMFLAGLGFLTATSGSSPSITESTGETWPPKLYVLYAHRRWLYEESLQTFKTIFTPLLFSLQEWRQFLEAGYVSLRGLARTMNLRQDNANAIPFAG